MFTNGLVQTFYTDKLERRVLKLHYIMIKTSEHVERNTYQSSDGCL